MRHCGPFKRVPDAAPGAFQNFGHMNGYEKPISVLNVKFPFIKEDFRSKIKIESTEA